MAKKRALVLSGGGARGAYQAGVLRYLEEIHWKPDIICGTSVGAINACAIGSGMNSSRLSELWLRLNQKNIMRYSVWNMLKGFFRRKYYPLVETYPLKKFIHENMDFTALNESKTKVIISAVNILTSELKFFENPGLRIEHILASSAIPMIFPWQMIDGEPYWDGGVMANTPILPALTHEASEIVVVLLSPVGGVQMMEAPETKDEALERLFELYLLGSYRSVEQGFEYRKAVMQGLTPIENFLLGLRTQFKNAKVSVIAPKRMLGLVSILNFKKEQAEILLRHGYEDAKEYFTSNQSSK
ncbi:patatin-like phospholipase family protein [Leptospira kanakyensis]|uniref:Patatin-like phospholipase family protein n=1 Tax=Leptospira kanakyensis TaxID=2484968 RepID=A0A6N4Q5C7_9LEPT|nr:patatin-like phospholipase family protein [Leptospira kanakyensis]MCW7470507.1 patatin-like phospholipase family protein [Leptospira kanakyensis]MCW7481598.1 patatin-like phospholipase family protein [Leptospira kanakyensis]TGK53869.1 patatin-like phospholipase family protein [Leptospira kanakyensis]TGK57664.1 patatin-like phospholipase family protein [Leptospira kanakyensis]TGK73374.1 patatin-like phospholipase family protein [Leptospira kanakyensis]